MTFVANYASTEPTRASIDALRGAAVLEFGAPWCPICQGAQPDIQSALAREPALQHLKVEDGSGRPLGRSFRVKLWPTLIFLKDGKEVQRLVRPSKAAEIETAVKEIL